jgi:magnesium transporter
MESELTRVSVIDYNEHYFNERQVSDVNDILAFQGDPSVIWVNIEDISDPDKIKQIGDLFHIHPIYLKDILDASHRPKIEDAGDYLFITIKTVYYDELSNKVIPEQLGFIIGKNFLITSQETGHNLFTSVLDKLRSGRGQIRKRGVDYLVSHLFMDIIEDYYTVLERLSSDLEIIESKFIKKPKKNLLESLYRLKSNLILVKKQVWPLREITDCLAREDFDLLSVAGRIYWKNMYDRVVHILDTLEAFQDTINSVLDVYSANMISKIGITNIHNIFQLILTVGFLIWYFWK